MAEKKDEILPNNQYLEIPAEEKIKINVHWDKSSHEDELCVTIIVEFDNNQCLKGFLEIKETNHSLIEKNIFVWQHTSMIRFPAIVWTRGGYPNIQICFDEDQQLQSLVWDALFKDIETNTSNIGFRQINDHKNNNYNISLDNAARYLSLTPDEQFTPEKQLEIVKIKNQKMSSFYLEITLGEHRTAKLISEALINNQEDNPESLAMPDKQKLVEKQKNPPIEAPLQPQPQKDPIEENEHKKKNDVPQALGVQACLFQPPKKVVNPTKILTTTLIKKIESEHLLGNFININCIELDKKNLTIDYNSKRTRELTANKISNITRTQIQGPEAISTFIKETCGFDEEFLKNLYKEHAIEFPFPEIINNP